MLHLSMIDVPAVHTNVYLLFAHDAELSQPLQVLCLGGLLWKFLWGCPSCWAQCSLLLRPCYTNTGHRITVSLPTTLSVFSLIVFFSPHVPITTQFANKLLKSLGLPEYVALPQTLSLNSNEEPTEDWRQESRDKGRRERIRESNNTLATPTGALRRTQWQTTNSM